MDYLNFKFVNLIDFITKYKLIFILLATLLAVLFIINSRKQNITIKSITSLNKSFRDVFYKPIYSDTRGKTNSSSVNSNIIYSKLLKSEKYNLTGKPDFVYKNIITGNIFLLEIKSGKVKDNAVNYGDIMQLASYFLICEEYFEKRPKKGYLQYENAIFEIKNNVAIRNEVLMNINDMREMLKSGKGENSASFVNCKHCVCRGTVCDFCQS